jgi:hypothetical protein
MVPFIKLWDEQWKIYSPGWLNVMENVSKGAKYLEINWSCKKVPGSMRKTCILWLIVSWLCQITTSPIGIFICCWSKWMLFRIASGGIMISCTLGLNGVSACTLAADEPVFVVCLANGWGFGILVLSFGLKSIKWMDPVNLKLNFDVLWLINDWALDVPNKTY